MFRTWDDVKFLRDNWDGPLILKGIQRVQDAEKAMSIGVDGIVVSNHGLRLPLPPRCLLTLRPQADAR